MQKGVENVTLQQLKYIVEVANCGSFNDAAKNLFITQPSLSGTVRTLEEEIGFDIFRRNNRGIEVTVEGREFLGYARQVLEQTELMEEKYLHKTQQKQLLSVSTQHYMFAVNAFVNLIHIYGRESYEFALRETKTYEIMEDVQNFKSEIGILYLNTFNEKILLKFIKEKNLVFEELFRTRPYIFIGKNNPLAAREHVTLEDLEELPYLRFDQGEYNSFYFSEEILSTVSHKKTIVVNDRATLFNLLIGLNGYTISTGFISNQFGDQIIAKPLLEDDEIKVGYVLRKNHVLSKLGQMYIDSLKKVLYPDIS